MGHISHWPKKKKTLLRTKRLRLPTKKENVYWKKNPIKTYNTGDSLVVTDPTTSPAVPSLTKGERTGSRIFLNLWSYVFGSPLIVSMRVSNRVGAIDGLVSRLETQQV
jgi:hypothetical protein